MSDDSGVPVHFRLNVEVAGLKEAEAFYATLPGVAGRGQATVYEG